MDYQCLGNSSNPSVTTDNIYVNKNNWEYIQNHYDYILQKQFILSMHANIGVSESDSMNVHDFEKLYELFVDYKKEEKEYLDKAR